MTLGDDLQLAASAASSWGPVTGVLAAEPTSGRRSYLVALGDENPDWLVLDESFQPISEPERVREVASIVVLCELAAELAGGRQLEELRSRLVDVRMTENPDGIEEAEEAALALERAIGAPPIVASPAYLDGVGAATRALEEALGEQGSPFAGALAASAAAVEAFVSEVESRNAVPLR